MEPPMPHCPKELQATRDMGVTMERNSGCETKLRLETECRGLNLALHVQNLQEAHTGE